MAIPKIMLSSTCFDLKQIRENLESFIRSIGYDTIRSEKGDIGYNIKETLKNDCYLAAQQCDILVGIIGGNFGSVDVDNDSISMQEMKTALEYKKQIYLFVDKNVLIERGTYNKNKDSKGEEFAKTQISYSYVNDTRIFDFINEMYSHQSERVVIFEFQTSADISEILKKQWANLFQAYLSQKERDMQSSAYTKISESADKIELLLNQLEMELTGFNQKSSFFLENISTGRYISNPILIYFNRNILKTTGSIIFKNFTDLKSIMELLGYELDNLPSQDYVFRKGLDSITFSRKIFTDDTLLYPKSARDCEELIKFNSINPFDVDDDDDLPF